MSKITVYVHYGRETTSFPFSQDKTFSDLAKKIRKRIKKSGEGLLPSERDELLSDRDSGRLGFIRNFSFRVKGEEVYPAQQDRKVKEYAENGEMHLTPTFHYEGGT